jgi:hypothetical protein
VSDDKRHCKYCGNTAEYERGYRAGIEAAAKVCEEQAQDFLSEYYATPQPLGSFSERYACGECAKGIRELGSAS